MAPPFAVAGEAVDDDVAGAAFAGAGALFDTPAVRARFFAGDLALAPLPLLFFGLFLGLFFGLFLGFFAAAEGCKERCATLAAVNADDGGVAAAAATTAASDVCGSADGPPDPDVCFMLWCSPKPGPAWMGMALLGARLGHSRLRSVGRPPPPVAGSWWSSWLCCCCWWWSTWWWTWWSA